MSRAIDDQLLMQILGMTGTDVDHDALRGQLLARAAEDNPQFALLARYLSMRQAGEASEERAPEAVNEGEASQQEARHRLQAHLHRLNAEVGLLRERSYALAEALGACERCWGADTACRRCGGDGAPGAFLPDVPLFNELVMPAIRRLKRWSAGRQPVGPSVQPGGESDQPSTSNGRNPT